MEVNKPQGSMGIPKEAQEAVKKFQDKKEKEEGVPERDTSELLDDIIPEGSPPVAEDGQEEEKEPAIEKSDDPGPKEIFKELGVTFNEEDLKSLLITGAISKEVTIIKGLREGDDPIMSIQFRTLINEELDLVDEIITRDAKEIMMSNQGYADRKSLYTVGASVEKINGRPLIREKEYLVPGKSGKQELDLFRFVEAKRNALGKMSPYVTNMIMGKYNALHLAVTGISRHPEEILKNS